MKWGDRKTVIVSTSVFLVGIVAGVVGAIVWRSDIAISLPIAVGLATAITLVTADEGSED